MTGAITVGATTIPYRLRRSLQAKSLRIVVTPADVEVVVPLGAGDDAIAGFLTRKRRWLFDATREIEARSAAAAAASAAPQFRSGAKYAHRGRMLMLDVTVTDAVEVVEVECRSKFHVRVPSKLEPTARDSAVRGALARWSRDRTLAEVERLGRKYAAALGVTPAGYRLSDAPARWGSCGADGVLRVHGDLAAAPAAVLAYVVAHEVAHLVCRHHGAEFWAALGVAMPDWSERKAALEKWEKAERRGL